MATPDYSAWDRVRRFTIVQAAFLWLEMEVEAESLRHDFLSQIPHKVRALAREIGEALQVDNRSDYGLRNGVIRGYDGAEHPYWRKSDVTRDELVSLANRWGERPPFLFPEARQVTDEGLSDRGRRTYHQVIRALVLALAEAHPATLKKPDGTIFVGYSKSTGDSGIVGHLIKNNFATLSSSALEKQISDALKAE